MANKICDPYDYPVHDAYCSQFMVPSLLSGPLVLTSPAPNTLSMSLDVDEQTNCVGVDTLFIRRAVFYPVDSNKYHHYVERDIAFADADLVFEYVPPGHDEYICIVDIACNVNNNNTRYITTADYISMPCGTTTVIGEFCWR